ncbi:MAG: PqqD family protein [Candidatus Omnitrophica bacterium]|nr:PqqD family protein [Candidatus Omnitrophota bacterium]
MKEDKILKKNPDMVSRMIDKETILVPVFRTSKEANFIYSLNTSASKFWDLIDGKRALGDIKAIILQKFDTTPKEIDKEINNFLKDLKKVKAVV